MIILTSKFVVNFGFFSDWSKLKSSDFDVYEKKFFRKTYAVRPVCNLSKEHCNIILGEAKLKLEGHVSNFSGLLFFILFTLIRNLLMSNIGLK